MKGTYKVLSVVAALLLVALVLGAALPKVPSGTWASFAASLSSARANASAAMLADGRILISGGDAGSGPLTSVDLFGTGGSISAAAPMNIPRSNHFSVTLQDGRVLVGGGTSTRGGGATNAAEIYDPTGNTWTQIGPMTQARSSATATLLQDGRVLIAGGDNSGTPNNTVEIFDPASGSFSFAGTMSTARTKHATAVLQDGRVLMVGGFDGTSPVASSDIFDPASDSVSPGPSLATARYGHSATTLLNGDVAIIGGAGSDGNGGTTDLASIEIFDSSSGAFKSAGASLATAREGHQAFLLPNNNNVLIVGGTSGGTAIASSELMTPQVSTSNGSWSYSVSATGAMTAARAGASGSANQLNGPTAVISPKPGLVIVGGGSDATGAALASTEIYGYPTVQTDQSDYAPGTTVNVTGSGFQPNETVNITLVESPLIDTHGPYTVQADGNGNISDSSFITDVHDLNVRFWLSAVGSTSRVVAQNTFTDAFNLGKITSIGTQTPNPVIAGAQATYSITVAFSGNSGTPCTSTLSVVSGLPSGATASFSNNPFTSTGQDQSSTLTVTTSSSTPPGTTTLAIRATGSGGCSGTDDSGQNGNAASPTLVVSDQLIFGTQPSTTTAGSQINPAITVKVADSSGNAISGNGASISMAIGTNPSAGTLSGTTTVNAVNGVATFSNLSIDKAGTGYTLATASTGSIAATSTAFNINPGTANKLAFFVQPSNTASGASITPSVQVQVQDSNGNLVPGSSAPVTIAIGNNPSSGTLSGTLTQNAINGVATFNGLSIDKNGTGYTLVASSSGLTSATSNGFNITAGAATKLVFGVEPSNTAAGAAITPAVTVQVEDANNNIVTVSTAAVTIAIGTNPGGGTLSGTKTVNAVNGVATFSTLSIDKAGTGYTLTVTANSLASATSNTFNISAGTASKLVFLQQPTNTAATQTITPAVTVQVEDANNNLVSTSTASVSVAIGTNPNSGTLSGTKTVNAVNGVATFGTLSIDKAGNGYTLAATSTGLTSATSSAFNITAGTATQLVFVQQPTNALAGANISPAVTVQVEDAGGNIVSSSNAFITLAIGTNPGGGTLSGTTTVNAVSGTATFSNLSINKSANGYTLTASSGALSATSSGFNVYAANGSGTMTVSPTTAPANSTGNAFTFAFVANNGDFPSGSQATIVVPAVWTKPNTNGNGAGMISITSSTCTTASISNVTGGGTGPWTITVSMQCANGNGFSLLYDGNTPGVTAPATQQAYTFTTQTQSGSGGTLTNIVSSPVITVDAPNGSGTMVVAPTNVNASSTGDNLGFTFTANNGDMPAGSLVDLTVPAGWSAPQTANNANPGFVSIGASSCSTASIASVASGVVSINAVCANGNTFVLKYANATAPSTTGASIFTTQTRSGNILGSALANIASSPAVTVNTRTTSTSVSLAPNAVVVGQATTVNVTVTDNAGTGASNPAGSVSFTPTGHGSFTGTCTLGQGGNPTGSVSCQVSYTPSDITTPQTIVATYSPSDSIHAASSGNTNLTVNARSTSTAVSCTPNPDNLNTATTCTATVTDTDTGTKTTPGGTVSFSSNGTGNFSAPSCTLSTGSCSVTYTPTVFGTGSHRVTGTYAGDTTHAGSNGFVDVAVNNPATTLSVAAASGTYGGTATLSATLAVSGGSPVSGKSISFTLNGNPVGSATTDATGTAAIAAASLSGINAGIYPAGVGASFAGDATYLSSNGSGSLSVGQATAAISVTPYSVTYDSAAHTATGTATGIGGVNLAANLNLVGTTHTSSGNYLTDPWSFHDPLGNYADAGGTVHDVILQATPSLSWNTPADITYGMALGSAQLNATSVQSGTFTYTPAAGSVLSAGNGQTLTVVFTPTDLVDFTTTSTTVQINVLKATPLVVWKDPADITYGTALGNAQLNAIVLPPSSALTGWWKGDGDAKDAAGGNDGTAVGVTFPNGQVNQAFSFAGSGDLIAIPYNSGYDLNAPGFTAGFWVSGTHNTSGAETILDKSYDPNAYTGWTFEVDSTTGMLQFDIADGSTTDKVISSVDVLDGNFHYITGLWDGAKMELFVDGISQGSKAVATPANNTNGLTIGARANTSQPFQGLVDEVQIFRQAPPAGTYSYSPVAGTVLSAGSTQVLSVTFDPTDTTDLSSATANANINVTKASQTIIFGTLANHIYGDVPFTVSATGGASGNPVTFAAAPTNVCTVNGSTITITGAGTCTITASQAGNANYNAATDVLQSFTVSAKVLTASIVGNPTKPYDGNTVAALTPANFSISGLVAGDSLTVTKTSGAYNTKDVATATTVTASLASSDFAAVGGTSLSNYTLPTTATGPGAITAANLTLNVSGGSFTYNALPFAASCNVATGLVAPDTVTLTITYASGTTPVVAPLNAGSYTATCTSSGNPNYQTATAQAALTIAPATVAITATDQSMTFGGSTPSFTATYGPFQGTESSSVISGLTFTVLDTSSNPVTDFTTIKAGTYSILPSGAMAANYTFTYVNGTLTVNKATLAGSVTVTPLDPATVAYGQPLTATVNLNSYSIGGVPVLAKHVDPNNPSDPTLLPESLTVYIVPLNGNPSQAVKFGTAVAVPTYDSTTNTTGKTKTGWTATITAPAPVPGNYNAFVYGDDPANHSLSNANPSLVDAGYFYPDTSDINYPILQSGQIDVVQATVTVTFTAADKTYDGSTAAAVSNCMIASGRIGTDNVTCTVANGTFATKNANAGTQTVSATATLGGANSANYTVTNPVTTMAKITPATLTISGISANSKVYDRTTAASLSGTPSLIGVISGDNVSLNASGVTASFADKNVGTAKLVTVSGFAITGTDAGNYTLTQPTGLTADITSAPLTVVGLTGVDKQYDGGVIAILSGTAALSGVISGDMVTLNAMGVTATFANKNVGAAKPIIVNGYTIGGADASNYTLSQPAGLTASITPATLTYTANPATRTYGAADPAFSGTVTGFVTGENQASATSGTLVFTSSAIAKSNVGSYPINGSGLTANYGNYVFTQATSNATALTITQADATITVTPYSATYDGGAHTATGTATGVFSESLAGLDLTQTTHTSAGTYNDSWKFTDTTGNYKNAASTVKDCIQKANATVVVTPYSVTYDGKPHTAMVTSITGVNGETGPMVGTVDVSNTTHTAAAPYSTDSWSFTGAANYNNIADTIITDTITKANVTVTFSNTGPFTFDASPHAPTFAVNGVNNEVLTASATASYGGTQFDGTVYSAPNPPTHGGNYMQTVAFAGNSNYNPLTPSATQAYTISKANQTITFGALVNHTFGDSDFAVSATSSSGLIVSFAASGNCTVSAVTVHITGAGSCMISASQPGNNDYNAATPVPQTFTIAKATPSVNWSNPANITFGTALGSTQLNATFTWVVNGTTVNVAGTATYAPGAGTVLNPGQAQTLTVSFIPTDSADYTATSGTGKISVLFATGVLCNNGAASHAILQPINADGTSVFKAGSTVPTKFVVCDAFGNSVGPTTAFASVVKSYSIAGIKTGTVAPVDETVTSTTPDTNFRWDPTAQQWMFNTKTGSGTNLNNTNATYLFQIVLIDGTIISATNSFGMPGYQYGLK